MLSGVDKQISVRCRDMICWEVALTKELFNLLFWHVGKKVLKRIIMATIADGNTFKIP